MRHSGCPARIQLQLASLLLALVETGCAPVSLTADLNTISYDDLDGALPRGSSAHPKLDPATGELHAVVYSPLRTWAEHTVLDSPAACCVGAGSRWVAGRCCTTSPSPPTTCCCSTCRCGSSR